MSSVFLIPEDRRADRLAEKAKRLIHGSSIMMIFTPDWNGVPGWGEVVVGWSKKSLMERGQVWKFPCGKTEVEDVPDMETVQSTRMQFTNCAARECMNESGLSEKHFEFIQELSYVRYSFSRDVGPLQQWHFLALLKERFVLPTEPIESDEMGDPEYWKVVDVLQLPTRKNPIPQERKMNPFHQIALARCILELRDAGLGDDPSFAGFKKMLEEIYDAGIDIDTYERDVTAKIKSREL
jgi:8-oxo-dGTP pyrophosphatase MutT (NUDIX family)